MSLFSQLPAPGTNPDFRNIDELTGRALMMHLTLAHRVCSQPDGATYYATEEDLRAQRSDVFDTSEDAAPALAQVGIAQDIWAWFRFSTEAPGPRCIQPADVEAGAPGRWHKQTLPCVAACGTDRYYQHIELVDSRLTIKDLWNRCRGKTPACFISFEGMEAVETSQTLAFYQLSLNYQVRVLSANFRGGVTARWEPARANEAQSDPGASRMIGDVCDYIVKDNNLSGTLGIKKIKIGSHRPAGMLSVERIICDALSLSMVCAVWTPSMPCEFVAPWRIWMQLQDALGNDAGPPNQIPTAYNPTSTSEPS